MNFLKAIFGKTQPVKPVFETGTKRTILDKDNSHSHIDYEQDLDDMSLEETTEYNKTPPMVNAFLTEFQLMEAQYKLRDEDERHLNQAISSCKAMNLLAPKAVEACKKPGVWNPNDISGGSGYVKLNIIYYKQGKYQKAIDIAKAGQAAGWEGDWNKRITRAEKKLGAA